MSKLKPLALRRQARKTVDVLTDPELTTPEPKVRGLSECPARYAEQMEVVLDPFQTALDAVEAQKREVEKAQKAKNDLLDELRDRLRWSIHTFEGLYHLAGLGFHADRLRLKVGSRSSNEEAVTDPDADAGEDGAGRATPPKTSAVAGTPGAPGG